MNTRMFSLLLVLPSMTQWDRIAWLSVDSILDDVAQRAPKDATLELSFLGAFARRDDDLPRRRRLLNSVCMDQCGRVHRGHVDVYVGLEDQVSWDDESVVGRIQRRFQPSCF